MSDQILSPLGWKLREGSDNIYSKLVVTDGTPPKALKLLEKFHDLLTTDTPVTKDLGKLVVFCGVRDYPARVKCATLAWHTLKSALAGSGETVTTDTE